MASAEVGSWAERLVDRAVGIYSPKSALLRKHFRQMDRDPDYRAKVIKAVESSGYRKRSKPQQSGTSLAHVGRTGHDPRSADATSIGQIREQRAKSRALRRENALAAGLINGTAREVVGTGIRPQSLAEGDLRDTLEQVFRERCDELFPSEVGGFLEAQRLMIEKLLEDGEVLVKPAATTTVHEPIWFELVEADRLSWPTDVRPTDPEGAIRDGVERDRYGRIVAYWVSKWHPGDLAVPNSPAPAKHVPTTSRDFVRVPRGQVKHLALTGRPGQSHGVPWLAPVDEELARLDLLVRASLDRVTMAACLAVFIESPIELDGIIEATAKDYGYELDQALTPGMWFKLAPGEKVQHLSPNFPVNDVETFVKVLSRRIGTALGLSYLAVSYDASGYNYSSARTDLIRDRRLYRSLQRKLVDEVLTWIWITVLEDARLRGDVRMRGVSDEEIRAVGFTLPTQEWVDPANEGKAVELKLGMNLTTLRDEAAALGKDAEDLIRQRALETKLQRDVEEEILGAGNSEGLDGGQITTLKEILADVSAGAVPPDSAKAMILLAFPGVSEEHASKLVDPVKGFTPRLAEAA